MTNKRASRLATTSNTQPKYTGLITIDFDELVFNYQLFWLVDWNVCTLGWMLCTESNLN